MPEQDTSWWVGFWFGGIAASLIVGALLGLIPFVLGQLLRCTTAGRVGFFITVIAGFVGGVILALPSCLGFVLAITAMWWRERQSRSRTIAGAA